MNRKNLTTAVLAGLAGAAGIASTAQAVNVNPDGLGQVLLFPYYTVNGGNDTLLSVVNTTDQAKAVKVRFNEGQNTREVLDFNLYMSAYDVWTAALTVIDGNPGMLTRDTTCTVPYIYGWLNLPDGSGGWQEFLPYALTDGGDDDLDRTTEGHFEMIEMGVLVDDTDPEDEEPLVGGSAWAATHVDGVPPLSGGDVDDEGDPTGASVCGQLVEAWTDPNNLDPEDDGYWLMNPLTDIEDPTGGLFGGAAIVNVLDGFMVSYDAKAINGFATSVVANDVLHQEPGTSLPSINSGDELDGTVFLDNGDVLNSGALDRGVDAVSFVFMHDSIMNEYTTEAVVAAATEWVMTFPTKSFYVYEEVSGDEDPIAPFTTTWQPPIEDDEDTEEDESVPLILPCEIVGVDTIWDREERSPQAPTIPGTPIPPIVSPAPPIDPPDIVPIIPFELCYEVSVISFGSEDDVGDTSAVLGSSNFHNIDNEILGYEYGWVRLEMDDYIDNEYDDEGDPTGGIVELSRDPLGGLEGLPVTGFAVQRFVNGAVETDDGTALANYGGIFQHKATRKEEVISFIVN